MSSPRDAIVRAFGAALYASDPVDAVRSQIKLNQDKSARVAGLDIAPAVPIEGFAIGKAAASMMTGAVEALGDRLKRGFVLTKDGHKSGQLPDAIVQVEAAHPVLDERNLRATAQLLDWLAESSADGVMLCLISGGGSALLELPVQGVSLSDFQYVTKLLINAGADIHQLNAVRSQISQVKGGRLRTRIPSRTVVNLIVSDVLGNDVSVIASGPTVKPASTVLDSVAAVSRLGVFDALPKSVKDVLASGRPQIWRGGRDDLTVIVADNEQAISAAGKAMHESGMFVERSPIPAEGEASGRAREFVQWLRNLRLPVTAAIGGGEYTVKVTGSGIGGRNTEFALAAAIELDRLGVRDWTVASLATDGDDAMTAVAGGIVDGFSAQQMRARGFQPEIELANNNSLAPLKAIAAHHFTGPTGTNVNDLYVAVRLTYM